MTSLTFCDIFGDPEGFLDETGAAPVQIFLASPSAL
jgi:hypothetical protein